MRIDTYVIIIANMNTKKYLYIGIGVFLFIVFLAAGITAEFKLSNITGDVYGYIENFFNQWSLALGAAGTIILALSVFLFIYENRRREEREKEQAVHALHDEIHWNLRPVITLRFDISEMLRYIEEHHTTPSRPPPFELLDTRVFDDMRSRGQLHLLEDIRMDVYFSYTLIKKYNMGREYKPEHLELLTELHERLDKVIRALEAKFKFLPHYVKEKSETQETETENDIKNSGGQEHREVSVPKLHNNRLREYILFQAPAYFLGSLLFMYLSGLSKQGGRTRFPIGNFEIPFLDERIYIGIAILLLAWTFVICIAPYNERLMKKITKVIEGIIKPLYVVIVIIVFGVGWIQGLAAMLNTGVSAGYFYLFFVAGLLMLGLIVVYPWYARYKQKHRIY